MKPQILSRRNAPVSIIGFLLLMTTTFLGCPVLYKGENGLVRRLNAVVLTADDVPTMEVDVVANHLYDNLYTVLGPEDIAYFKRVGQLC